MTRQLCKRLVLGIGIVVLVACQQNASQAPTAPSSPPAAQAPSPLSSPPRQNPPTSAAAPDRSLAFISLDVNKFSMEAIQANKKRVEANPADAEALMQLGHANYMIQRFPSAKDYYERAVRANGTLLDARLGLINCYAVLGRLDDALREVNALLAIEPAHPQALYNQGLLLLYGKQDRAGAKRAWDRLISSHPGSELSRYASAQLDRMT